MRHLRRIVLAAVVVAVCVAPVADAHHPENDRGGAVVAPAKDKWLGEAWAQLYSLPVSENPFAGHGRCLTVGHKVVQALGAPCTIERGTAFTLGFGTAWSNVEDPFPQTRAEQLALALAADQQVVGMTVTVDGGDPVEIRTPRFELFSPQRTVLLPADNILGVEGPQTITLSAHGWGAVVRKLGVGEHEIVGDTLFTDGEHLIVEHIVTVVPKHDHDRGHAQQDDGWNTRSAPAAALDNAT
jgi:hypothetical protein